MKKIVTVSFLIQIFLLLNIHTYSVAKGADPLSDAFLKNLSPYINESLNNNFENQVQFNLSEVEIVEVEQIRHYSWENVDRTYEFDVTLEVFPFDEKTKSSLGKVTLKLNVKPDNVAVKSFEHSATN
ncbi:DUF3888 domain-containing protein [Evansella sp. AB-P1]|uniref:DUF3888 domain-containing protein n=1 Tax=Evansella sp. AB-P1 TaxID=3037653 RepID=UPI00241F8C17|nr:DUF3888 domain-containing protein [Evansella sp. AB-P1]MDG5786131.1 DUF3888 domain-containing protein [Evansella sp. AB-P1]